MRKEPNAGRWGREEETDKRRKKPFSHSVVGKRTPLTSLSRAVREWPLVLNNPQRMLGGIGPHLPGVDSMTPHCNEVGAQR